MRLLTRAKNLGIDRAFFPLVSRLIKATPRDHHPLPEPALFRPINGNRRYGVVHYNVVIPDLPGAHRFFACMVVMGQSGTRVFDADHAIVSSPRDTATVAMGTAATAPDCFHAYSISEHCELHEDGSLLRFGEELEVRGTFPEFRLTARCSELSLDLELRCTPEITWFMRSPVYDHIGLPARYSGTLRWRGRAHTVSGLCSFEHAQCVSPIAIRDRAVPELLKLPVDLFTYHVLKLDQDSLLLLTHVLVTGRPLFTSAHLKRLGGEQSSWFRGVECEVLTPAREPLIAPDGRATPLPRSYRWRFGDALKDGLELEVRPDTPLIYGLGSGWIGGASYEGCFRGRKISGSAYYEHGDRRRLPHAASAG